MDLAGLRMPISPGCPPRTQPPDARTPGPNKLAGRKLEEAGVLIAKRTLEPLVAGTE